MECVCDSKFGMRNQYYSCNVTNANIEEPGIKLSIHGKHLDGYSNNEVTAMYISGQDIKYMPAGLGELFPNLKMLSLWQCGLRRISKNDLMRMQNLERIYIHNNNAIKYIPRDLFECTRNLKKISFVNCEFQFIEDGLVNGLKKLERFHIDSFNLGLLNESKKNEFRQIIQTQLKRFVPNEDERKKYHEEGKRLKNILKKRSTSGFKEKSKTFGSFLESGKLSDVKINIEDETFKVHKLVLGARSSVLAEIFENNENVKQLNLKEIKKETFKNILNFIYKDELPAADTNYLDLYSACGQLNIVALMQICEEIIKVEEGNAIEVAIAAKKFGSQKLKDKAFEVVQEMFSDYNINKDLIEHPEDLKIILETRKSLKILLRKYSSEAV